MYNKLHKIEDVRKNALHFYGVDISSKNGDYYLDFPDGVSAVISIKRSFGEDGIDAIAKMIKGYKGTKYLKLPDDTLLAIRYNLSGDPSERSVQKVAAGVFAVALAGFVLFTLAGFNAITGLAVGNVLIDSSGWQIWVGLVIALVVGVFAVRKFMEK